MAKAARLDRSRSWRTIRLVLTDNKGIQDLHARWMGAPLVTDVLSQCYAPIPGEAPGLDGEIVVNVQRAVEDGPRHWKEAGCGPRTAIIHELALYVAHGCDHLAGSDDASPRQRQQMRGRERRWVRAAAAAGLLRGVVR